MDRTEFDAHRATVTLASGELAYTEFGTGRAVLFIHGLGTNGFLWRNAVQQLGAGYRCLLPDLPGHGASPAHEGDPTLSSFADVVEDFCAALGLSTVDLVSNDTGGAVAQLFAVRHPERLSTFTITNCEAHDNIPNEAFRPTVEAAKAGKLGALAGAMLGNPLVARSPNALGGNYEDPEYLTEDMIRGYLAPVAGTPEAARYFERLLSSLEPANLTVIEPDLRKLDVPTQVVWGTADLHFDLKWAYWLRDTIAGATAVVEVDGGKLHFPDERAAEFAGHLRRHLAAHPAGAGR
jgi:pimeloyl-ACP methyl ester carboxylesterase